MKSFNDTLWSMWQNAIPIYGMVWYVILRYEDRYMPMWMCMGMKILSKSIVLGGSKRVRIRKGMCLYRWVCVCVCMCCFPFRFRYRFLALCVDMSVVGNSILHSTSWLKHLCGHILNYLKVSIMAGHETHMIILDSLLLGSGG